MELSKLTDDELRELKQQKEFEISKFKNLQLAKKVQLNSAYGALGNQYFRFYDVRQAEAITLSGQLVIQWIEKTINDYLNKTLNTEDEDFIIAMDTDSVYVRMDKLVKRAFNDEVPEDSNKVVDFLDKVADTTFKKIIDSSYDKLANYVNAFDQKMIMDREAIARKGIWTAKKRYALYLYDFEGVRHNTSKDAPLDEIEIKDMGLETVKSSTPQFCRDKLKIAIKLLMTKDEQTMIKYISDVRKEFNELKPEEIAFPRGVNNLDKFSHREFVYCSGTPQNVKASLIYNHLLKKHKLTKKYHLIKSGDKMKFLPLLLPNAAQNAIIAFPDELPKEFNLHDRIDYDKQFEKSFLHPLEGLLKLVGWETEKQSSLLDLL